MKILITGAGGFVGQVLTRELLRDKDASSGSHELILTDIVDFSIPEALSDNANATIIKADLATVDLDNLIPHDLDAIYMLHGIMSAGAEADFDLGFRANFESTRRLLFHLKTNSTSSTANKPIRVIYASSLAVYGRPLTTVTEQTYPTPEGSYGAEKVMCETLINDFHRRGFIDAFAVRLPGITVRPGLPSKAASSFLSGIFREPLAGKRCVVPTTDREMKFWICSPKVLVGNLVRLLRMEKTALSPHRRVLNLPGKVVSYQDMRDALVKVGGEDKLKLVDEVGGTEFEDLVQSWPWDFDVSLALHLGLEPAEEIWRAVQDYVEEMKLN